MKNKLGTISSPELHVLYWHLESRLQLYSNNIKSVFLMSDSKPVLRYSHDTETNFGPYIMRICNEIQLNTRIDDWIYKTSEINIADIPMAYQ